MATYTAVVESSEVDVSRPVIAEVTATIGDLQVRNRGTIGGNVCSNDPTNHLPPLFAALDATFTIQGKSGTRWVSAEDFFLGVYMTAVGEGELLTKISVPASGHARDGFAAVTIGADGTCIVNAAASLDGDAPRLAIGCVDAVPGRPAAGEHGRGGDPLGGARGGARAAVGRSRDRGLPPPPRRGVRRPGRPVRQRPERGRRAWSSRQRAARSPST